MAVCDIVELNEAEELKRSSSGADGEAAVGGCEYDERRSCSGAYGGCEYDERRSCSGADGGCE